VEQFLLWAGISHSPGLEIPSFYGTWNSFNIFTRTLQIQCIQSFRKSIFTVTLLGSPSKIKYYLSFPCVMYVHLHIIHDLFRLKMFVEQYKLWCSSWIFLQFSVISFVLNKAILHLISNIVPIECMKHFTITADKSTGPYISFNIFVVSKWKEKYFKLNRSE
jgi:hypothetical protein